MTDHEERRLHAVKTRDMEPHVDTLAALAEGATVALDLGVRTGVSAWALLDALPQDGTLYSVDINYSVRLVPGRVKRDPRWHLIVGDDREDETWEQLPSAVDFAFLDTSHEYPHTLDELRRIAALGPGVIALHDWNLHPVQRSVIEFLPGSGYQIAGIEVSDWGLVWLTL